MSRFPGAIVTGEKPAPKGVAELPAWIGAKDVYSGGGWVTEGTCVWKGKATGKRMDAKKRSVIDRALSTAGKQMVEEWGDLGEHEDGTPRIIGGGRTFDARRIAHVAGGNMEGVEVYVGGDVAALYRDGKPIGCVMARRAR